MSMRSFRKAAIASATALALTIGSASLVTAAETSQDASTSQETSTAATSDAAPTNESTSESTTPSEETAPAEPADETKEPENQDSGQGDAMKESGSTASKDDKEDLKQSIGKYFEAEKEADATKIFGKKDHFNEQPLWSRLLYVLSWIGGIVSFVTLAFAPVANWFAYGLKAR